MPDLLAHAFLAYTLGTLLRWRLDWLSPAYVTVVMAGAFVPDLTKVSLLLESRAVATLLGVPFDWYGLHTVGGVALSILIGVTVVAPRERRRVLPLLGLGAASHLLADALLRDPSGRTNPLLFPFTVYHPPTPGWYLSTEPGPTIVTGAAAVLVWAATRRRVSTGGERRAEG